MKMSPLTGALFFTPRNGILNSTMKNDYKALPHKPGVYLFKDGNSAIVYVGKAKDLKKRVGSYFSNLATDWKIQALFEEATRIDHIITEHENQALILEAELIQEHQPKFNTLLKTGQPFLFLLFTDTECLLVRNKKQKGKYFGPFIHKQHARRVHSFLISTFKLYKCNKKIENGCLDYHLGRCAGNCKKLFDGQDYAFRLLLAQDAVKQNRKDFIERLEEKIKIHSAALEFEKAKHFAEYQENLETIFTSLDEKFSPRSYALDISGATIPVPDVDDYLETAEELKNLLELEGLPERIDCFDISHFQSSYIVGSCIRFYKGKPDKNSFRRFKVKSLVEQNDYAALQECVMRRYKEGETFPDIILIDGGKGQRNAITPLVKGITCISLAKKEELLFSDNHKEGFPLNVRTKSGKLLICLRDYAHHFAISYHRLLRNKFSRGDHDNRKFYHRKSKSS